MNIKEHGVDENEFLEKVSYLEEAFEDQCTTANPKLPLVRELDEVYLNAYRGF